MHVSFIKKQLQKNDKGIKASIVKSSETWRKKKKNRWRKQLRTTAKDYVEKEIEEVGETLKSGAF